MVKNGGENAAGKGTFMKKCFALLCAVALICLWGCGGQGDGAAETTQEALPMVGVALPEDAGRFSEEGAYLQTRLESLGYTVMVEYAQQDAALQCSQVERLLLLGADCLVVTAVDPLSLINALQQAEDAAVPVIAYDRALPGCPGVDLYVGFDGYQAGQAIAKQVEEKMSLATAKEEQRSHTVEFFMGAPEDANALARYQGIMAVLQPYLESGVLKCLSGRVSFEDTCTPQWSADTAQFDCRGYLDRYYETQPLEICVAASDALAEGCVDALNIARVETFPVLTGQELTLESARRIAQGQQLVSAVYDYDPVVQMCADAAHAFISGGQPQTNGETGGVKAYLFAPETVTGENYEKLLIESGRYTKEQLS